MTKLKKANKELERKIKKSCEKYRAMYKKAWLLINRRKKWKMRRIPSKRARRQNRCTYLTAEEDLIFTLGHGLTENGRKRMKAQMRRKKVDWFAKNRERSELINEINPAENWTYEKVFFLHFFMFLHF